MIKLKAQRSEFTKLKINDKLVENIYLTKLIFTIHKNKTFRAIQNKDRSHKKISRQCTEENKLPVII